MIRPDGSVASANNPTKYNSYDVLDFGKHLGVVINVNYTDDSSNQTAIIDNTPKEVTYDVLLIGGYRSGQVCYAAKIIRLYGGTQNYTEHTLKPVITLTRQDLTNPLNFSDLNKLNGDFVYIEFLSGNLRVPVISGIARHPSNSIVEAASGQRQQLTSRFNGITKKIDRDGAWTWTKDNGSWLPYGVDATDPTKILTEEFIPFPGLGPNAVSISLGNQYDFLFKYNTGLSLSIDGKADAVDLGTAAGAGFTIDGLKDSHTFDTTLGTAIKISGGASDSISLATAAGAAISIAGLSDSIDLKTASGTAVSIAPTSISAQITGGTKLTMDNTSASLLDITGAGFKVSNGQIALGGPAAELVDLIDQAFTALSTTVAAGFGAPISSVATFVQLAAMIKLIKGSL